jgi:hypothetical protein
LDARTNRRDPPIAVGDGIAAQMWKKRLAAVLPGYLIGCSGWRELLLQSRRRTFAAKNGFSAVETL